MKVPVHILVLTDPVTRIVHPVACNESRSIMEGCMSDTADNLEMTAAFVAPSVRQDIPSVIKSLRIVEGILEFVA